ncbi:MAG: hypothetical protein LBJ31_03350 [Treponema sp.]|jgi:flagellar basal body rod protein FlgF|nr:hypothetical protein [Treponema sp.]
MKIITLRSFFLFFLFLLFLFHICSYAAADDINNILIDINNTGSFGLRPISFGEEYYIQAQGMLRFTNIATDIAIKGEGFFVLFDADCNEIKFTRNGHFAFDGQGYLVNHDGYYVLGNMSNISGNVYIIVDFTIFDQFFPEKKEPSGMRRMTFPIEQKHPFLIMRPSDITSIVKVTPEYYSCDTNVVSDNHRIISGTLESMPIPLEDLLIKSLAVADTLNDDDKNLLYMALKPLYTKIKSDVLEWENFECLFDAARLRLQGHWTGQGDKW